MYYFLLAFYCIDLVLKCPDKKAVSSDYFGPTYHLLSGVQVQPVADNSRILFLAFGSSSCIDRFSVRPLSSLLTTNSVLNQKRLRKSLIYSVYTLKLFLIRELTNKQDCNDFSKIIFHEAGPLFDAENTLGSSLHHIALFSDRK